MVCRVTVSSGNVVYICDSYRLQIGCF
ncbi:MAG: hypothetical protein II143_05475 [Bacteroidales bacterium]|nr:hypothetical protein [Bacteroidales bacterium]